MKVMIKFKRYEVEAVLTHVPNTLFDKRRFLIKLDDEDLEWPLIDIEYVRIKEDDDSLDVGE